MFPFKQEIFLIELQKCYALTVQQTDLRDTHPLLKMSPAKVMSQALSEPTITTVTLRVYGIKPKPLFLAEFI